MIEITGIAVLAGWAIYFWRKTAEYDRVIVQLANQQNDIVRILIVTGVAIGYRHGDQTILAPGRFRPVQAPTLEASGRVDSVPHKG